LRRGTVPRPRPYPQPQQEGDVPSSHPIPLGAFGSSILGPDVVPHLKIASAITVHSKKVQDQWIVMEQLRDKCGHQILVEMRATPFEDKYKHIIASCNIVH